MNLNWFNMPLQIAFGIALASFAEHLLNLIFGKQ
jgi:hypothetical protein